MIIEALTSGLTIKLVLLWLENYVFFQNSFFLSINWQKIKFKTPDFSPTRHHKIVFSSQI